MFPVISVTIGSHTNDKLTRRAQSQKTRQPRVWGDKRVVVDRSIDNRQYDGKRGRVPSELRGSQTIVPKIQNTGKNRYKLQFKTVARLEVSGNLEYNKILELRQTIKIKKMRRIYLILNYPCRYN